MKTGFQQFQQNVQRQQQQHQRRLQGFYYLKKKRERELRQQRANLARRIPSSTYAPSVTPITEYEYENPLVWLIKLPFRILFFVMKAVAVLAVAGFMLFVAVAVLSAFLG